MEVGRWLLDVRALLVLCLFFSTLAPAQTAPVSRDVLRLRNGDILRGTLRSIDSETVRWHRPDMPGPVDFEPESVGEIVFEGPRAASDPNDRCEVRFTNGDILGGTLEVADATQVVLETPYAGRVTIPRTAVQAIVPAPAERLVLFDGPTGIADWTHGKVQTVPDAGQWRYREGAFYATAAASIARDLDLPDVASIRFHLEWKGELRTAIAIYTDSLQPISLERKEQEPEFGGFYSLQLNNVNTIANLMRVTQHEPLSSFGMAPVPQLLQRTSARVELLVSKPRRSIALLVDGNLIKQWIESEEFAGEGGGMRFVHQGAGSLKLSHLRISEWNGFLEEPRRAVTAVNEDVAHLSNGDHVSGRLEGIRDGRVSMVEEGGRRVEFPIDRARSIEFAATQARVQRGPRPVKAFFAHGGTLSFNLERVDEQGIVASSSNFGILTFDRSAFSRLVFHNWQSATEE